MSNPLLSMLDAWRRRRWRPDAAALARYRGLQPMVVVTGGSDGIGLAIARRFAGAGRDVMLVARRPEPLQSAARAIIADFAVRAIPVAADVTRADGRAAIDAALAQHAAYTDVLVNSAGTGLAGPFHDQAPGETDALVALNVAALTALMHAYLPGMRIRGRGGILNVASLGGYVPGPYQAAYYASKAYVLSLSEAVAAEVAGEGVRVTIVAPGPVDTGFHHKMRGETGLYLTLIPVASPESVARAAVRGYTLGLRVVVPGLLNPLAALVLRIAPHRISVPIIGWLLRPRG